jgi:2-(1,2-epoxy-1,2-dihydrophenyl)acetyl-CoA isomerase
VSSISSNRFETIIYEKTGAIATLTMNRPDRLNGMTNRMLRETRIAVGEAAADRSLRVLILTGAGKGFCPGADIGRIASDAADDEIVADDFRVPVILHEMPCVTIAAVNGACAGAGLGWALACDLRFSAASAKFNTAFLDVGVAGDMGGPWTLARIVGPAKARELYFFPDKFDAETAHRIGMVSRVFSDDRLMPEVHAIADRLAAAAPIALRALKSNFVEAERMDLSSYVAFETERHFRMFLTEDTKEAFRAKSEKRTPQFKGR